MSNQKNPSWSYNSRFLHLETLQVHKKSHEGELLVLKCNFCLEEMPDETSRKDHEASHVGPKPYVCTLCGKCYKKRETLVCRSYSFFFFFCQDFLATDHVGHIARYLNYILIIFVYSIRPWYVVLIPSFSVVTLATNPLKREEVSFFRTSVKTL